ncbi:MAG: hypothetical protein K9M75_02910, partial [Phycisphaerae bacterium]|nr:hypothetical protein [Phycisphaerae bacterium]
IIKKVKAMQSKEMDTLKRELTDNALEIAKALGYKLDYSHKSVKRIEKMLKIIHNEYLKAGDDGLSGIALSFAAYIISVIELNSIKGQWKRDHPQLGTETFPYEWNGATIFPYAWCMKRIVDGKQDNVWSKYKTIVLSKLEN